MPRPRTRDLTTPDLVLLSLLAERPLHGYEANAVLELRQVRDWAGVSRPQVYYSLEKLSRLGFIRATGSGENDDSWGPERHTFATTSAGRNALADALEREDWTTDSDRPAFLTWLALSWKARPGVAEKQIERRRKFVEGDLKRHQDMLVAIRAETRHRYHEAMWMVGYRIGHLRMELNWLRKLTREIPRRAPARNPNYAASTNA